MYAKWAYTMWMNTSKRRHLSKPDTVSPTTAKTPSVTTRDVQIKQAKRPSGKFTPAKRDATTGAYQRAHVDALTPAKKGERVALRLTPETKQLLAMAASLGGTSLTDFVVASARMAAERRIQAAASTRLNVEDSLRFAEALLHPAAPNAKLKAAARRHRDLVST